MTKLPISAIVASYNEGELLEDCLKSIQFCNEIVLIDMESTDNTAGIAEKHAHKIIKVKRVELVEQLFAEHLPGSRNDWVMLIDPDERIDTELEKDIRKFFEAMPADCGRINVPIQYYYKGTALKGTVWGGKNKTGRLLVRRSACDISSNVHTAITLREGYTTYKIKRTGNNIDHHFWIQSFGQMLEKHKRYTQREGKSKYDKGERFSYLTWIRQTFGAFRESFFTCRGYLDGFLGLFLSGFYAWYVSASWLSLKRYQSEIENGNPG